jgi:hypothetical protein
MQQFQTKKPRITAAAAAAASCAVLLAFLNLAHPCSAKTTFKDISERITASAREGLQKRHARLHADASRHKEDAAAQGPTTTLATDSGALAHPLFPPAVSEIDDTTWEALALVLFSVVGNALLVTACCSFRPHERTWEEKKSMLHEKIAPVVHGTGESAHEHPGRYAAGIGGALVTVEEEEEGEEHGPEAEKRIVPPIIIANDTDALMMQLIHGHRHQKWPCAAQTTSSSHHQKQNRSFCSHAERWNAIASTNCQGVLPRMESRRVLGLYLQEDVEKQSMLISSASVQGFCNVGIPCTGERMRASSQKDVDRQRYLLESATLDGFYNLNAAAAAKGGMCDEKYKGGRGSATLDGFYNLNAAAADKRGILAMSSTKE